MWSDGKRQVGGWVGAGCVLATSLVSACTRPWVGDTAVNEASTPDTDSAEPAAPEWLEEFERQGPWADLSWGPVGMPAGMCWMRIDGQWYCEGKITHGEGWPLPESSRHAYLHFDLYIRDEASPPWLAAYYWLAADSRLWISDWPRPARPVASGVARVVGQLDWFANDPHHGMVWVTNEGTLRLPDAYPLPLRDVGQSDLARHGSSLCDEHLQDGSPLSCVVVLYVDGLAESYKLEGGVWTAYRRREGVNRFIRSAEHTDAGAVLSNWCMQVGEGSLRCPNGSFNLPPEWDLDWSTLRVAWNGRFVYGLSNDGELLVWPPDEWARAPDSFKAVPMGERWRMIWFGDPGIAAGITLDGRLLYVVWLPDRY